MAFLQTDHGVRHEARFLRELIADLEIDAPRRESTTADERRAQERLGDELAARGCEVEWMPFRYSPNLYAVIALHYAVATFASIVYLWQPWLAAPLHLLPVVSYLLDCHYRGFWLRRCFAWRESQNVVARLPVTGEVKRRLVFISHADAAPTGWMFSPKFLKVVHAPWPNWLCLLRKQMLASMLALLGLVVLDIVRATTNYYFPFLYLGLTLTAAVPLVLLLQIVVTNRTVPGANDNLTGCAALVLLCERLAARRLANCEVVFVVSGCEEAGRGGAWALEQQMRGKWDPHTTKIIALDTLSGGNLRYHVEGEIFPYWPSHALRSAVRMAAEGDERFAGIAPYHAPAGATDVAPFLWQGYDGLCLTRIDPETDLPPDYHVPADCSANLDCLDVRDAVDFAERLAHVLAPSEGNYPATSSASQPSAVQPR